MGELDPIDAEAFKQFERAGYSRVASAYDGCAARATAQVNEAMLDAVAAGPGTRLLDVACGPGWLSAAALKRGAEVMGIDLADDMVAMARARCPGAEIRGGDAEDLPWEAGRFEAVVCNFGLLHFPRPERAVAEAFRVLAGGGRYAFTCWTPPACNPFMGLILGAVQAHGTMDVGLPAGPPLFRFGDPSECESILRREGFISTSVTEVSVVWPFPAPEEVLPMVVSSTARLGPLLAQQAEASRHRIERAIVEGARRYATEGGVHIPGPALLAVGGKP
jgi:SAM-dependent methyltransferase